MPFICLSTFACYFLFICDWMGLDDDWIVTHKSLSNKNRINCGDLKGGMKANIVDTK